VHRNNVRSPNLEEWMVDQWRAESPATGGDCQSSDEQAPGLQGGRTRIIAARNQTGQFNP